MKTTALKIIVPVLLALAVLAGTGGCLLFMNAHTFVLSDEPAADSYLKTERIQPVFGAVKVWSAQDTSVWFTDAEDPARRFEIGYLTPGMSETVRLERGHWYIVHGAGEITVRAVNVSVQ